MVKLNNGVEMPVVGFGTYQIAEAEQCRQSVAKAIGLGYRLIDTAQAYGNEEYVGAGIKDSAEEILKVQKPFGTFITEGNYVPEHIGDALKNGHVHPVTFVNGTVRNEGSFFAGVRETFVGHPMTAEEYPEAVKEFCSVFGEGIAQKVLAEYPVSAYDTPSEAYAAIVTDAWFASTADNINRALAGKIPVYAYEFDDQTAPYYLPTSFPQKAAHTYELPYIFPGFHGSSKLSTKLNKRQEKLSREMMALWSGVSRLKEQNKWQPYSPEKENYLRFTLPKSHMTEHEFGKTHHIDFWNSIDQ